jgi:hypothetical protein
VKNFHKFFSKPDILWVNLVWEKYYLFWMIYGTPYPLEFNSHDSVLLPKTSRSVSLGPYQKFFQLSLTQHLCLKKLSYNYMNFSQACKGFFYQINMISGLTFGDQISLKKHSHGTLSNTCCFQIVVEKLLPTQQ